MNDHDEELDQHEQELKEELIEQAAKALEELKAEGLFVSDWTAISASLSKLGVGSISSSIVNGIVFQSRSTSKSHQVQFNDQASERGNIDEIKKQIMIYAKSREKG